jgi:hypothetical protein
LREDVRPVERKTGLKGFNGRLWVTRHAMDLCLAVQLSSGDIICSNLGVALTRFKIHRVPVGYFFSSLHIN